MLNFISQQANANLNHDEIPPYIHLMAKRQRERIPVSKDVKHPELSDSAGGSINWSNHFEKLFDHIY